MKRSTQHRSRPPHVDLIHMLCLSYIRSIFLILGLAVAPAGCTEPGHASELLDPVATLKVDVQAAVTKLAVSPDGRLVAGVLFFRRDVESIGINRVRLD